MPIQFKCECGKTLQTPDYLAGKRVRCPSCQSILHVPTPRADLTQQAVGDISLDAGAKAPPHRPDAPPSEQTAPPETEQAPELQLEPTEDAAADASGPLPEGPALDFAPDADSEFQFEPEGNESVSTPQQPAAPPQTDSYFSPAGDQADSDLAAGQAPTVEPTDEAFDLPPGYGEDNESQAGQTAEPEADAPAQDAAQTCAKCGAPLIEGAKMCVSCGAPIEQPKPGKPVKKPVAGPPSGILADKRKLIAIAACVLALAGAGVWAFLFGPLSGKDAKPAVGQKDGQTRSKPAPKPSRAPKPKPEPPKPTAKKPADSVPEPDVSADWSGFAIPRFKREDRLRQVAAALHAFRAKNAGKFPAALSELKLPARLLSQVHATCVYAPRAIRNLSRFRVLLWERNPVDGVQFALFSDESVRGLTRKEMRAFKLARVLGGYVTPAERAILTAMAPTLKLVNERFPRLEMLVDGKPAGAAAQGETASVPVSQGAHSVAFRVKGMTSRPVDLNCRTGVTHILAFRLHTRLPFAPLKTIARAAKRRRGKPGPRLTVKRGKLVKIELGDANVNSVGSSAIRVLRSNRAVETRPASELAGWLEYPDGRKVVGALPGALGSARHSPSPGRDTKRKPILVSSIQRLAEGDVFYPNGAVEQFRALDRDAGSRFGALSVCTMPADALARLTRFKVSDVKKALPREGEDYEEDRPRRGRSGPATQADADELEPMAAHKTEAAEYVDLQALRPALARLGRPALPDLLALAARADAKKARAPARGRDDRRSQGPDQEDEGGERRRRAEARPDDAEAPTGPLEPSLPPAEALAVAGACCPPASTHQLATMARLVEKAGFKRAAIFALALPGDANVTPEVQSLAGNDNIAAAAALALLPGPTAFSALKTRLDAMTPQQMAQFFRETPQAMGAEARLRIVRALRETLPKGLRDRDSIEALCEFAPGAAENALSALALAAHTAAAKGAGADRGRGAGRSGGALESFLLRKLARLHNRDTLLRLIADMRKGTPEAKARAVDALREIPDPSLAGVLAKGLELEDAHARALATFALLRIGTKDSVALVRRRLDTAGDNSFGLILDQVPAIARKLGKSEAAGLLASLWKAASREPAPPKKAKRRGPREEGEEPEPRHEPNKEGKPETGAPEPERPPGPFDVVSAAAAQKAIAAARLYSPDLLDATAAKVADANPKVRAAAILAMASVVRAAPPSSRRAASERAVESATKLLKDQDPAVVSAALRGLATASGASARATVIAHASDKRPLVRAAAFSAAIIIGGEPDLNMLRKGLGDPDAAVVAQAIRLAANVKNVSRDIGLFNAPLARFAGAAEDAGAVEALCALADTLGRADGRQAVTVLGRLLANPNPQVRTAVINALGRIADSAAVRTITPLLSDAGGGSRRAVVDSLIEARDGRGIPALAAALTAKPAKEGGDRDSRRPSRPRAAEAAAPDAERTRVVMAALRFGTPHAFSGLERIVDAGGPDALREIVELAQMNLPKHAKNGYIRFLESRLGAKDRGVRLVAAKALIDAAGMSAARAILAQRVKKSPDGILGAAARAEAATKDPKALSLIYDWFPKPKRRPSPAKSKDSDAPTRSAADSDETDDPVVLSECEAILSMGRVRGAAAVAALRKLWGQKIFQTIGKVKRVDSRGKEFRGPDARGVALNRALIEAFALTSDPSAVGAVAGRLSSYSGFFRPDVVRALARCGHLDPKEAMKKLDIAMRDHSIRISAMAADAVDSVVFKQQAAAP